MQDTAANLLLEEYRVWGMRLRAGLSLHSYMSKMSGETVYQVCDHVGCILSTVCHRQLDRFFELAR